MLHARRLPSRGAGPARRPEVQAGHRAGRSETARHAQTLDELVGLFWGDLLLRAQALLRRERGSLDSEPAALVSELYLRLRCLEMPSWESPDHFLGVSARMMKQVLIDRARTRDRQKRGNGATPIPLCDADGLASCGGQELALRHALGKLGKHSPLLARVFFHRFLQGLSTQETASLCGISIATVKRYGQEARQWLSRAICV